MAEYKSDSYYKPKAKLGRAELNTEPANPKAPLFVNQQDGTVIVADPNKVQVTVQPWALRHRTNDPNAVFMLAGAHWAQYISAKGPLYSFRCEDAVAEPARPVPPVAVRPVAAVAAPAGNTATDDTDDPEDAEPDVADIPAGTSPLGIPGMAATKAPPTKRVPPPPAK